LRRWATHKKLGRVGYGLAPTNSADAQARLRRFIPRGSALTPVENYQGTVRQRAPTGRGRLAPNRKPIQPGRRGTRSCGRGWTTIRLRTLPLGPDRVLKAMMAAEHGPPLMFDSSPSLLMIRFLICQSDKYQERHSAPGCVVWRRRPPQRLVPQLRPRSPKRATDKTNGASARSH